MSSKQKDISTVSVVHAICCGLYVHKKSVSAGITTTDAHGAGQCEVREFETFTDGLLKLRDELALPVQARNHEGHEEIQD